MRTRTALGWIRTLVAGTVVAAAFAVSLPGRAQEARHFRFAYDQPRNTGYSIAGYSIAGYSIAGYSIAGDIFAERLKELSKGTMPIDQYPGGQLGQEPQVLQLMKAGEIEFCITSSANAATLSPQAGVPSPTSPSRRSSRRCSTAWTPRRCWRSPSSSSSAS